MNTRTKWGAFLLGALLTVLVSQGLSSVRAENDGDALGTQPAAWKFDKQIAAFRSTISAVDSTGSTSAASGTAFKVNGRKNLPLSARFTTAAEDCKVFLYYYWSPDRGTTNYFLGCSNEITLTAGAVQDANGHYVAPTYVFSGNGAYSVRVVVSEAPSSGTVSFWLGSF